MKVFTLFKTEIHDHYLVLIVFAAVILITYINVDHANKVNCHILEPDIQCDSRGPIDRSYAVDNPEFVFIPSYASLYGLDEFRQKPMYGFMHIECQPDQNDCTFHYDTFNGVVGYGNMFNWIAHAADNFSTSCYNASVVVGTDCFGLPDYLAVLIIWAFIIFGGYYLIKHTVFFFYHGFVEEKWFR